MLIDPWTAWPGGFPYQILSKAGVIPESNTAAIKEAGFTLTAGGMSPEARVAWDTLRMPGRRLVIDFFVYRATLLEAALAEHDPGGGHEHR